MNSENAAEQLRAAIQILEQAARDRLVLTGLSPEEYARLMKAAGQVFLPEPRQKRRFLKAHLRRAKAKKTESQQAVLNETGIRQLRARPVFTTPNPLPAPSMEPDNLNGKAEDGERELIESQHCYICKRHYSQVHHFYDQLCPECAELNFRKRTETADLTGRVALLTGGRVKIGYQAGIRLLRSGAHLIVTTRFPRDSAARYAREPDFQQWSDRLEIFGLDLRHTPSVEAFCQHLLSTRSRLDFTINNACQTVRRPPEFYEHMMAAERGSLQLLQNPRGLCSARMKACAGTICFPRQASVSRQQR